MDSKKELGSKINSMALTAEFSIVKLGTYTLDQWKRVKETEEEGFMTLSAMKFTMVILK